MGTPIPDDDDLMSAGEDCLACYSAGHTPKWLTITFHDVIACAPHPDPPNDIPILITQLEGMPCRYSGWTFWNARWWRADYIANYKPFDIWQSLAGLDNGTDGVDPVFRQLLAPCALDFPLNVLNCANGDAWKGSAHVQLVVPAIIIWLCTHSHLMRQPGKLFEIQQVGMDHKLVRIATKYDKSCCYFYIDSQELTAFP